MGEKLLLFLILLGNRGLEETVRHRVSGGSAADGWRGLSRTRIQYFPSFFGHRVAQDCYKRSKCFRAVPAPLPRAVLPRRCPGSSRFPFFSTPHRTDQRAARFYPNYSCKRQRAGAGCAEAIPAQPLGDVSGNPGVGAISRELLPLPGAGHRECAGIPLVCRLDTALCPGGCR